MTFLCKALLCELNLLNDWDKICVVENVEFDTHNRFAYTFNDFIYELNVCHFDSLIVLEISEMFDCKKGG